MPRWPAITLALLLPLLAVCGGAGSDMSGRLVVVRGEGIVELSLATGEERVLLPNPEESVLIEPAVSPDGEQIAYVRQLTPVVRPDEPVELGLDLYLAQRDGSNPRLVQEHQQPNEQIRAPAWLPDGERLLLNVQRVEGAAITTQLELLDLASGERTVVVEDAFQPDVSPDGTTILFVRQDDNLIQTLWLADVDGGNQRRVSGPEHGLGSISSPRFSPDGEEIAFAASPLQDVTVARDGDAYVVRGGARSIRDATRTAYNGLPMDVYSIAGDSGEPRLLAEIALDQPSLAWSGDGARLFAVGGVGLFAIDPVEGGGEMLAEGTFHGQLDWLSAD